MQLNLTAQLAMARESIPPPASTISDPSISLVKFKTLRNLKRASDALAEAATTNRSEGVLRRLLVFLWLLR